MSPPYDKLSEIIEIEDSKWQVNEKLGEGWVYLGLKINRVKATAVEFSDHAIHILGKPVKEKETDAN